MTDGDPSHGLARVPLVVEMAGVAAVCPLLDGSTAAQQGQLRHLGIAPVGDAGYRRSLGAAIGENNALGGRTLMRGRQTWQNG